jgi:hypothetical protein
MKYNLAEPDDNPTESEYNLAEPEYKLQEPKYSLTEQECNLPAPKYYLPEPVVFSHFDYSPRSSCGRVTKNAQRPPNLAISYKCSLCIRENSL